MSYPADVLLLVAIDGGEALPESQDEAGRTLSIPLEPPTVSFIDDPVPSPNPTHQQQQHQQQDHHVPVFDYAQALERHGGEEQPQEQQQLHSHYFVSTATAPAGYPPSASLLETAAHAAAATTAATTTTTMNDSVALTTTMQEAATIVMQAHEKMQYEQPYTYADANAEFPTIFSKRSLLISGDEEGSERLDSNNKKPRTAPSSRVAWEERIRQLQAYREEHGNLLVPTRYKGHMNLGKFVHNMREQYKVFHRQDYPKKCGLTDARIRQLEEMGFQWTTKRHKKQEDDWGKRFGQLMAFKAKHGHCNVPHGYKADPSFAEWVHRQRTTYQSLHKGKAHGKTFSGTMAERFERLRQVGFLFQVQSDKWMDHWRQLKAYKEVHSDCQVPTHYAENPALGRWVHTQRHQRRLQEKGKKSCISEDRIALLDQLGFSWEVRPALDRPRASWQHRLEELQAYAQRNHGSVQVDADEMPNLYAWCLEQRQRLLWYDKHKGDDRRISPERVEALHAIGFTKDTVLLGSEAGSLAESSRSKDASATAAALPSMMMMDASEVVDKVMGDTDLGEAVVDRGSLGIDDAARDQWLNTEQRNEEAAPDPSQKQPILAQEQEEQREQHDENHVHTKISQTQPSSR